MSDDLHDRVHPDPSGHTTPTPSAARNGSPEAASHREKDGNYRAVAATLKPKLRVIRSSDDIQWVIQVQDTSPKGHLLEERLAELACLKPKREKVVSPKHRRAVIKDRVTRETLATTEQVRSRLKRGDLTYFGVDPAQWAIIEALPDYFPREGGR